MPWAIAFLPGGDWLVTERAGRVRLVKGGTLQPRSVATIDVSSRTSEGGLLGIALHPDFQANHFFYVFYTLDKDGSTVNRVQRFVLSDDHTSATPDRVIIDDIPAGAIHDGGRIKFGPDGFLYVATGDNRLPASSQNASSLSGKILKLPPDGGPPTVFASGLRNPEGFDWIDAATMVIADHGPTGEYLGRTGGDEVNIAREGDNFGWPTTWRCEQQPGLSPPALSWQQAAPPGGAAVYKGDKLPQFTGNLFIGTLGSMHLHRVVLESDPAQGVQSHEVYFQDEFGRLRDVESGPDGYLYVTTSNCDGRGVCPADGDAILRIE